MKSASEWNAKDVHMLAGCTEGTAADAALPGIERLNAGCFCVSVDEAALEQALEREFGSREIVGIVRERCPFVYSARPVFVAREHMKRMAAVVAAIESVVTLPSYREQVLAGAPVIARQHSPGTLGVFFGYDFHVAQDSFGLIEVNTNAGGAMLNVVLGRAHRACCLPVRSLGPSNASAQAFEEAIVAMFSSEWRLAGRDAPLRSIAIVDEDPAAQYLYPEFLLFQRLFERHGIQAVLADPREFELREGALWAGHVRIDLVYNRLTDFYLESESSKVLNAAYQQDAAVLTPHPQAHALYADKRNLVLWSDPQALAALGVPSATREVLLAGVPRTVVVDGANAEELWAARRRLFFKPFAGYGSRAAYRGDKVTQRVWSEIIAGGYVAQALVAPGERRLEAAADKPLKFDLREYVYDGRIQWSAARLYQGQTTNFRTPGGGFAPVYAGPF
jgi:hypothetical protein